MSSSQRSESINHLFDGFVNSKTTLKKFIDKYEDVLEKRYEAENEEDNKSLQTNAFLKTSSPFERQASTLYTRRIFKKFQNEILEMAASNAKLIEEVDNCAVYSVKSFERIEVNGINREIVKNFIVSFNINLEEVTCQCRSFQFRGYLCRHALLVLHQRDVCCIPRMYFLNRWCKDMKFRFEDFNCDVQFCDKSTRKSRYALLSHRMMKLAEVASISEAAFNLVMTELTPLFRRTFDANCLAQATSQFVIRDPINISTKGRPREKRFKSGVEKKSKKGKKQGKKSCVDQCGEGRSATNCKRQRTNPDEAGEVLEAPTAIDNSDPLMDEFDAFVCSQVTQDM